MFGTRSKRPMDATNGGSAGGRESWTKRVREEIQKGQTDEQMESVR